jgi:hypothetical protein
VATCPHRTPERCKECLKSSGRWLQFRLCLAFGAHPDADGSAALPPRVSKGAIRAWAARGPGKALEPCDYICHSCLSLLDNKWGNSVYPLVPGHEAVGHVVALGERAEGVEVGQQVGVGR